MYWFYEFIIDPGLIFFFYMCVDEAWVFLVKTKNEQNKLKIPTLLVGNGVLPGAIVFVKFINLVETVFYGISESLYITCGWAICNSDNIITTMRIYDFDPKYFYVFVTFI